MEDEKLKILAAFDLETTGLDPAVHDIIEIAIVPLNPDFKRSELPEFTARIKAVHPENADPESGSTRLRAKTSKRLPRI